MKNVIIVDLDGTICNADHRQELAQSGQWDDFHALCHLDAPYQDMVDLVRHLGLTGLTLIGLTGRNEKHRIITNEWLQRHGALLDEMLMRPDNDYSKDIELKTKALEERFGSKQEALARVICIFDDRDNLVAGLRDYGYTVLQPRLGTY